MDRRAFLKTLGAAIGTLVAAPLLPVAESAPVFNPKYYAVDVEITAAEIARLNAIAYQVMAAGFSRNAHTRDIYRTRGMAAAREYMRLTGEKPPVLE